MSNSTEELRLVVRSFLLSEFLHGEEESRLQDATPLISGGILDSIGTVRLVTYLEEKYGIEIPQSVVTVQHFDSVHRIVEAVSALMAKGE